ncbi:MAG: tagatose-bisphosphate aldolase [Candidatus Omnitrophica bacterium CG11_big_fil_rev_8_21_14_0_20_45_26]|uniref:tagatose-bisphosphate aldolase n=1 Tax=Candidatus Abzuiibacterium crystallinum TaxID=1974748 RepID=A0A2H0LN46_9BACT|nr:MAG: tagatose-bisphosphate aldolase [Candidatus Omnitrophica bacterium CG11_big_fil_rev_8_21_14_0_20_45_26]PIW63829.1 MAG: tagatose 1,6-diphosphate aldolase [Candidatus Omnitrophica bacterium CG12_big_fil_rev_8_21_14_0_65_45_16]
MKITAGKLQGLKNLSNEKGIIAAAAMDQRGSLKKAIAKAKGADPKTTPSSVLEEFKIEVTKALTPHATAILLDPEFGLPAAKARSKNAGLLLAYEKTGYDAATSGRLPDLLDLESVKRIKEKGADAVKILLYYTPDEKPEINDHKHAWIERIGSECAAEDISFFLEFVAYDAAGGDEKGIEFAKKKPRIVTESMKEFSKPRYQVDVLKVEVPVNMAFVKGSKANKTGETAYTRDEAKKLFLKAAEVATKPFIYLSAGVDDDVFRETLELANEAGVNYSGVLCGRATWKEGIPVYGKEGRAALAGWLADRGVKNIQALNQVLAKGAHAWWDKYGGKDKIEVVKQDGSKVAVGV